MTNMYESLTHDIEDFKRQIKTIEKKITTYESILKDTDNHTSNRFVLKEGDEILDVYESNICVFLREGETCYSLFNSDGSIVQGKLSTVYLNKNPFTKPIIPIAK